MGSGCVLRIPPTDNLCSLLIFLQAMDLMGRVRKKSAKMWLALSTNEMSGFARCALKMFLLRFLEFDVERG